MDARLAVAWLSLMGMAGWASADPNAPSDFATEVISYTQGTGVPVDSLNMQPINDPNQAVGAPTVDTTGDGWDIPLGDPVPVVTVYPAFRSFELVSVGNDGELILKFDHPVTDDPDNLYGVDLIVFGNAQQLIGGGGAWHNGNPNDTSVTSGILVEPGIVSVAQDPNGPWYTFSDGPSADDFAPTLGRLYVDDPNDADPNLGTWNLWWGDPTDPTKPLDPNLTAADFSGMTVAEMAVAYQGSAGGTGFDIGELGLSWIQYVRIEDVDGSSATTEIDAVADAAPFYGLTLTVRNDQMGEIALDPEPWDANAPIYRADTTVTLTATPIEGKSFKCWEIFDPNHPGDPNYAVIDSNASTTILMDTHREVTASFTCGSELGPMLPTLTVMLGAYAMVLRRRRRAAGS